MPSDHFQPGGSLDHLPGKWSSPCQNGIAVHHILLNSLYRSSGSHLDRISPDPGDTSSLLPQCPVVSILCIPSCYSVIVSAGLFPDGCAHQHVHIVGPEVTAHSLGNPGFQLVRIHQMDSRKLSRSFCRSNDLVHRFEELWVFLLP